MAEGANDAAVDAMVLIGAGSTFVAGADIKIFGTINTREKFLDERLILATHEWNRLKANDSLECRNCHDYDSMDLTRQGSRHFMR